MKKYFITLAVLMLPAMLSFAQEKKYEMVIQKTDGTEIILNTEDVLGVSFEKRESPQEGYLTCPDNNHPHMIDLGLPSGTLWACCNVGATTPEGYGGYYAWGETEEKYWYDFNTYILCDGYYNTCHDLGDDIAGTEYDVAHVKWGGSWVMPSREQIEELPDRCTSEWVTENGVYGRRFTGSNGGSIFLPAAGIRSNGDLEIAGSLGSYWSSTQSSSLSYCASTLDFDSDFVYWGGYYRSSGHPVRPVSPSEAPGIMHEYVVTHFMLIQMADGSVIEIVTVDISSISFREKEEPQEGTHTCPDGNHPHMIDLGLPSGTLWACCNVGATTPEGYGGYYAWGETEEKDYYDWSTYKWCNGHWAMLTKYCTDSSFGFNGFTDGLTELLPEDDAATANWGNGWQMPSLEQIKEILDNSTSEWVTENGVYGRRFTGSNGGSIFLPAAGDRWHDSLYYAGRYGNYWSSTQDPSLSFYAYYLDFGSDYACWYGSDRNHGRTVRPVRR